MMISNHSIVTKPLLDRALGAYLGFACGDALGVTVEYMQPQDIQNKFGIHQDLIGGGWLNLPAGAITDNTEMALVIGQTLIDNQDWNIKNVADQLLIWLGSNPTDIGDCCLRGLRRYKNTGELSGDEEEFEAGNSACIRNLPVILATLFRDDLFETWSRQQNHLTHNNLLSDNATFAIGKMVTQLIKGDEQSIKSETFKLIEHFPVFNFNPYQGNSTGYIVDTLQTVFHYFYNTNSFEQCLIQTVNQGGDTTANGALAGMLAGAKYGVNAIPERWLQQLNPAIYSNIEQQTKELITLAEVLD